MFHQLQSANPSFSSEAGIVQRKWRSIVFLWEQRSLECKLESVLRAAAAHESNSMPVGAPEYQLLHHEADSICTEFAERWGLDIDLLRARMAGLAKLERLSVPQRAMSYARLACFGVFVLPLALFLTGALAGLVSVGFHLVGGR